MLERPSLPSTLCGTLRLSTIPKGLESARSGLFLDQTVQIRLKRLDIDKQGQGWHDGGRKTDPGNKSYHGGLRKRKDYEERQLVSVRKVHRGTCGYMRCRYWLTSFRALQILFDKSQTIIGARIRTYLLERSRLVYQPETERNYHIFYQMLAGLPSSDLKSIGLSDASDFFYLNQGGASAKAIAGVDDSNELKITEKALDTVGITSSTRWQIFQVLGALLHIGNIEIKQTRSDAFIAEDDPHVKYVTDLLGIEASEYKKWTVKKQITTRSEKIVTALTAPQAIVVRDSVAKFIYACVFDWLVSVVNESLAKDTVEVASFIGVLDIYGFEHFSKSRCILQSKGRILTQAWLLQRRTRLSSSVSTMLTKNCNKSSTPMSSSWSRRNTCESRSTGLSSISRTTSPVSI